MLRIDSHARTIRQLLSNTKYQLDYYQREYSWQTKHVTELLNDLSDKFSESYTEGDAPANVQNYGHYFLGSIIISHNDGQRYIVDGQQRLTTLTLLLIRLHKLLKEGPLKDQVSQLIYSLSLGTEGFNLDVPEWRYIMDALYGDSSFDESDQSESIQNIALRYSDIEDRFEIPDQALSSFVYWLLENVYLVEIAAYDSKDAYMIFETVNDRGLSLTPTDMLRGYLLSNITTPERRNRASEIWGNRSAALKQLGKDTESEAIKAWLRSQYADSVPDFDRIGSEFHRWVRDQESKLKLSSSSAFASFIERDFAFYSNWYHRLQSAGRNLIPGLEWVYYNSQNITFHYPFLLAPLRIEDPEEENMQKVQIVATYIDIVICRRIWNFLSTTQNLIADQMFPIIPAIRSKSCAELSSILYEQFVPESQKKIPGPEIPTFANNSLFYLQGNNRRKIHLILARMIDYVEVQSGHPPRYPEYVKKTGSNSYEVEHIWANHPERHVDEFLHEYEFEAYRNRIGGLLLLPKKNNTSYGDLPYEKKREHYLKENLLAQSLHEKAYENNPGFKQFIEKSGLPLHPHLEFKKADLDARQKLYRQLAERIWNPERLRLSYGQEPDTIVEEEEEEYIIPILSDEKTVWTVERIENLAPADRRAYYKTQHTSHRIDEFYTRIAELQNLIQEEKWYLTLEFRNYYCAFFLGDRRVFGVNLFSTPKFAVWITEEEAESLRHSCRFENYYTAHRHAVYPRYTTVDTLRPIFEFAYKKHQGY